MSGGVYIRRKTHTGNFTVLGNAVIQDPRLSWKAVGVLTFLLHLRPDFELSLEWLARQKKCGRDGTRSALKELEQTGYLSITRVHGPRGHFGKTIWEVSEEPIYAAPDSEYPSSEKPNTVTPKRERPKKEKPTLTRTDLEQELNLIRTTTTKVGTTELQFPANLKPSEVEAIARSLGSVASRDAQSLLDELSVAMRGGKIHTTAVRWFSGLLKIYKNGRFVPTHGRVEVRARESDKADDMPVLSPTATRAVAEQSLKAMKASVRSREDTPLSPSTTLQ